MSDERARDEIGKTGHGDAEPDFEGHGNRTGEQVVEKQGDGEEPDFEGHGNRTGEMWTEKQAEG